MQWRIQDYNPQGRGIHSSRHIVFLNPSGMVYRHGVTGNAGPLTKTSNADIVLNHLFVANLWTFFQPKLLDA